MRIVLLLKFRVCELSFFVIEVRTSLWIDSRVIVADHNVIILRCYVGFGSQCCYRRGVVRLWGASRVGTRPRALATFEVCASNI